MANDDLRQVLSAKSSEELAAVYMKNDRDAWRDEVFPLIHEILSERGVKLPPQLPFDYKAQAQRTKKNRISSALFFSFPLALVATAVLVIPAAFLFEQLEMEGAISPPQWLAAPLAYSVIGLFFFLWKVIGGIIHRKMGQDNPPNNTSELTSGGRADAPPGGSST